MRSIRQTAVYRFAAVLTILSLLFIAGCSSPEERAQSHYERGAEYLKTGDHIKAMLEFRNAAKLNENFAPAWFGIATVEEQNQNWPAVASSLQRVIEIDAYHVEAQVSWHESIWRAVTSKGHLNW